MTAKLIGCVMYMAGVSFLCQAQTVGISGTVKDSETRQPLAFASVLLFPASTGTTTNELEAGCFGKKNLRSKSEV